MGNAGASHSINPDTGRLAAERLDDGARVVFDGDYVREHVSLGYAVTVHAAQGVTADTTHAVLGDTTTRNLFYVAMTRGRLTNTAYLYQRTPEADIPQGASDGVHLSARGSGRDAVALAHAVVARDDQPPPRIRSRRARRASCCPVWSDDW